MACNSPRIWIWSRVPDGSHIEVCVEAGEGSSTSCFDALARFDVDQGQDQLWNHAKLVSCTQEEPVTAPRRYVVKFVVTFVDKEECKARIKVRIRKPDGSTHGTPYCREVKGAKNDIERCQVVISTLQAGS